MRQIKFRAWQGGAMIIQPSHGVYSTKHFLARCYEDCELMQFVGFKDRNGVEVWESDVMKTKGGELYLIAWHPNTASFTAHHNGNLLTNVHFSYVTAKRWEVVGNIHQNEGLLK